MLSSSSLVSPGSVTLLRYTASSSLIMSDLIDRGLLRQAHRQPVLGRRVVHVVEQFFGEPGVSHFAPVHRLEQFDHVRSDRPWPPSASAPAAGPRSSCRACCRAVLW